MNNDRVKGAVDEVVGNAKRHIGNLTGDTRTEIKGAVQQVKGKVETAVGKLKDAAHDAQHKAEVVHAEHEEARRKERDAELAGNRNLL